MLNIDCLLKYTDIVDGVKTYMEYAGASRAELGQEASLRTLYNEMRKAGVEIDLGSAAAIYEEALTSQGHPLFNTREQLQKESGRYFEDVVRDLMLAEKDGEKQISELSPGQAVAKQLASTFRNQIVQDNSTKSILRTMQDAYMAHAKRMMGELPEKAKEKDERTFEEVIQQALDKESMGYTNNVTGAVNGFAELHRGAQEIVRNITNEINRSGDEALKEQWEAYAKPFEDAAHTIIFNTAEGKKVLHEALMDEKGGGFVKTMKDGTRTIDYKKLANFSNSTQMLRENVINSLVANGFSEEVANKVANSLKKEFNELRGSIINHGAAILKRGQEAIAETKAPVQRSELTRLAELSNYGLFDGAHDDLLHHILGIDTTTQQTRKDLKAIMEKKQRLIEQLGSKDFLYYSLDAELQRQVTDIIEKNIADKTTMGRVAKSLYEYQNFVNMGLIANPYNIAENTISGTTANLAATVNVFKKMGVTEGVKVVHEMNKLWWKTFKDVTTGGVHSGFEGGKFNSHSSFADKMTFQNWDKLNVAQKAGTILTAYAHAGLNAMDAAFKVSIHQKTTMLNLHKALTEIPDENGRKMSREEANEYLNENLFGKSLDDAKAQARYVFDKLGLKADENKIERSAREIVQANIYADGKIDQDVIEAATRSAFHVASISLGHEAQEGVLGYVSGGKMMKALQNTAQARYDKLNDQGRYNQAATHRILVQSMLINGVFRFSHGVANWMVLRPLTAGLGLATGGLSRANINVKVGKKVFSSKSSQIIDYNNKQDLKDAFSRAQQANMEISRATVGLTYLALSAGATILYGALNDEDKDDGLLAAGFTGIKHNPILDKLYNKTGADMLTIAYNSYMAKNGDGSQEMTYANWKGFGKYLGNLTSIGNGQGFKEKVADVMKKSMFGSESQEGQVAGKATEILKDIAFPGSGEMPFFKSYRSAYYIAKWPITGVPENPEFYHPDTWWRGFMNNGVINEIDKAAGLGIMYDKE